MSTRFLVSNEQEHEAGLTAAKAALAEKRCIVLPTDTVYGIGADAFSAQGVAMLLAAKGRGRSMPPPVLIAQSATMDGLARDIPDAARKLADAFWPGGLTLILQAQPSLTWDLGETRGTVGLRVPNDDTALELLRETGPLAVSSANRSGQPAALDVDSAMEQLGESVDVYLDGGSRGEDPTQALPSTIIDCTGEHLKVVRAGAISIEELRVVVPEVLDLGQGAPGQDA
ncbi:L-threonylcarbamoyladenylate synthase [Arthrobacter sp. NIO-1057]|uniref:L-threonylcarbamoyladenylate synthase n=1 Tax=Arthrobacter sp. NIO-1057 TaxID=993071 RepID=UPI00071C77E9|nr:L-threonylcarbamoyladenylate synthase [Arthrobacter sp. NIO-1057]KSU67558.1 translation factor SUA5 [Arthrobacter sp. NIO-1057]SCB72381.1 tRNA threonylcarbamoyl adenosine modification protein, Sua5/YciO/YrdC/YwlC family [Arthrobacter sp. NIO-1057]